MTAAPEEPAAEESSEEPVAEPEAELETAAVAEGSESE
jgi:hypothetical protein